MERHVIETQRRNVLVLSGCQASLQTVATVVIAVTGLAGAALASDGALSTVPLTCYVLGAAVTTIPASLMMGAIGRRPGFLLGTILGAIGAAVCACAMLIASFGLLCAGMTVVGMYSAFGKYYRFAAADAAAPNFRGKAISLTLAGGIAGGVLGPEIASGSYDWHPGYAYLGSYLALVAVCLVAALLLTRLDIPRLTEQERRISGRPLGEILRQPEFIVAAITAMLSYGIMNLMMTSTPLAMRMHDHHFHDAAFVLKWHTIGMFAPSFVTGSLIQRFGVLAVVMTGIALLFASIAAALADITLPAFWVSLLLLGVGWNFMYVGASALLTECHTPAERAKTQAANDFLVFLTMAITSTSSGLLLAWNGWAAVNYGSLPFLLVATTATLWLAWRRRAARQGNPLADPNRT